MDTATNMFHKLQLDQQPQEEFAALFFGETGSGKSTLINYMTNLFAAGSLDDLKIAIPTKFHEGTEAYFRSNEKNLSDSTKSKTADCNNYAFQSEKVKFLLIDTPGLSDTAGSAKDDQNIEKIMKAAESSGKLAAIVIVINGTLVRVTVNLENALVRMRGSMPDVLHKNIIVVLTNCSSASCNFDLASLQPWVVPKENIFYMNNSALSQSPAAWQNDTRMRKSIERDWQDSMEEIRRMVQRITELGQTSTSGFGVIREKRDEIKSEIFGVLLEINKLQLLYDALTGAERAEPAMVGDIKKYANFKEQKEVECHVLEGADYHSLICMVHTDKVCKDNCGMDMDFGIISTHICTCLVGAVSLSTPIGTMNFSGLGGRSCIVCRCGHEKHFHAKQKLTKAKKTVENMLHDVKAQFDFHTAKKDQLDKKVDTLKGDLNCVKQALRAKESTIQDCCKQLKITCSQFNLAAEFKSVIDALEAHRETLTSKEARFDADAMIRNIRELMDTV